MIEQINSSLESYKEFAKGSTNKMIAAGKIKPMMIKRERYYEN